MSVAGTGFGMIHRCQVGDAPSIACDMPGAYRTWNRGIIANLSGAGPLRLMRGPPIPTLSETGPRILSGPLELYPNA